MKRKIKYFVSYAKKNNELASTFLDKYSDKTGPSLKYAYQSWRDTDILVGEKWHEQIQSAINDCDFGLMLVSPAFLASQYIEEHELSKFIGEKSKPFVPVMLQPIVFGKHDLKGLEENQIFRLTVQDLNTPRSFYECKKHRRDDFATQLFIQIENRLDKLFS